MPTSDSSKDAVKNAPKPPAAPVKNQRSEDSDDDKPVGEGVALKPKFLPTGLSRAIVLASFIVSIALSAAILFANRYALAPAPNSANGFMYRINNLTGAVAFCGPQGCSDIPISVK